MNQSNKQKQRKQQVSKIETFSVPIASRETQETIDITNQTHCYTSKKAIALKPDNANAYLNLGNIFKNLDNLKDAEKFYRKAIEINPNFAQAYSNLGCILKDLKNVEEAELSIRKAIEINPDFTEAYLNLGNILKDLNNLQEAEKAYRKAIELNPNFAKVYSNLGNILKDLRKPKEAEISYRKAIELNPELHVAHSNLGTILKDLRKPEEAEISYRKAIELNPKFAQGHHNLGIILRDLGNLHEAELSTRKAIELEPDFAEAHSHLGVILIDRNNLQEAELYTRKAIELKPSDGYAHLNLGIILRDLGNLQEAELSTLKAIELEPNYATCYQNLSLLLYAKGNINLAIENINKALSIDPLSKNNQLLTAILKEKIRPKFQETNNTKDIRFNKEKFSSYPIILKRPVNLDLINSLYKIKTLDLNKYTDPSYGIARGSDYKLFEDNTKTTERLKKDLISITKEVVNAEVFFRDSFFTILGGKSTIKKHNHIVSIDKFPNLSLWKQKYSLVYYLSVGDQNCKHPGILKFYKDQYNDNSNQEILPSEGMIVIFPADKYHSVKYDGNKDRIIIGVNFYSI